MRILFVTPYYPPFLQFGGPPRKIHSIARNLMARGHVVRVLTFDHEKRKAPPDKELDGIPISHLSWKGRGLRQVPIGLQKLRDQVADSEIVHCYGLYNFLCPAVARASKRLAVPFVLEPLGMYPPRARNQWGKRIYNFAVTGWLVRNAAAVVAASAEEAEDLRAIADAKKIVVRRNGIDLERFANLPTNGRMREQWEIGNNEKVVLFVGRISPIKNLEQLILAFERANLPQARLVLVGPLSEPAYELKLLSLIRERGLESSVKLAGPLFEDDHRAALGIADLFVLPSENESFGNAAAEAVAAGIPVLLTDTCGIAPLIHERAGLAVPLGVDNLAVGLRLMLEPVARRPLVARTEEVRRELSWEEPILQTERLYENIVDDLNKHRAESVPDTGQEKG